MLNVAVEHGNRPRVNWRRPFCHVDRLVWDAWMAQDMPPRLTCGDDAIIEVLRGANQASGNAFIYTTMPR